MRGEWQAAQGRAEALYYSDVRWTHFYASINKRGEIKMNEALSGELEAHDVTVLWNAEERSFGLTGWKGKTDTFELRQCGRNYKTTVVRIARVLKEFQIDVKETREFRGIELTKYEGEPMVILSLDKSIPFKFSPPPA